MNCQAFDAILFHKILLNTASEYGRIPVFFDRIFSYKDIRRNMGQRKPVFWYILRSGICKICERSFLRMSEQKSPLVTKHETTKNHP